MTNSYLGYHLVLLAFLIYIIIRTITFYLSASANSPEEVLSAEDIPNAAPEARNAVAADPESTEKTDL